MDVTGAAGPDPDESTSVDDPGALDLSPRTTPVTEAARPRRKRNPAAYVVLLLVVVAIGVLVSKALTSASLFFYNADEAVAKQHDLGQKRFRLQGTVQEGTVHDVGDEVDFAVAYNGVRVEAHHTGSPPELFQPGTPVVIEGHWDETGKWFDSDRILVKHSEQYIADNGDRLKQAERGGTSTTATTAP